MDHKKILQSVGLITCREYYNKDNIKCYSGCIGWISPGVSHGIFNFIEVDMQESCLSEEKMYEALYARLKERLWRRCKN